ncbi:MAG: lipocalin-like domain-containing protein [Acidimicrobiia bacterium]
MDNTLVGTWRLISWTVTIGNRTVRPFGGAAVGLLTYTGDGRMNASLMREDRDLLDTHSFAQAHALDRAAAAVGYIAYAGTYVVDGDQVHHDVELSLFPDWVGTTQSRQITWVDDAEHGTVLELSYIQPGNGREAANTLRWHRITTEDTT